MLYLKLSIIREKSFHFIKIACLLYTLGKGHSFGFPMAAFVNRFTYILVKFIEKFGQNLINSAFMQAQNMVSELLFFKLCIWTLNA